LITGDVMARREWERPCVVCNRPIINSGTSKMHRECVGQHLRDQFDEERAQRFEPQDVTDLPDVKLVGRPFDDPRNNPKHNDARSKGGFLSPVRVGVIDIETTGLNAGYGVVLCAVIKAYAPDEMKIFRADEYEP